jgi:ELWxxDGT repeat protein
MVDAGNTLQAAKRVAFSRGFARYSDSLTPTDRNDYYRVDITTRKSFSARVFGLTGNADLALYGSRGGIIRPTSRQPLTREENINRTLDPGTYYLRVFTPEATTTTRYALTLSAFDDRAGNTQTRARALGDITEVVNRVDYADFVGVSDPNDYYSFALSDRKTVNVSIRGLRGDADLYLRDSAGTILQQSVTAGNASEVIARALNGPLTNGNPVNDPSRPVTYFLQVVPKTGVSTGYTLGISSGPEAGATVEKARNINLTFDSQTYGDALGDGDNIDLYGFKVETPSDFNLRLDGFNATLNADVQIYRNDGSIAPLTPQNLIVASVQGGPGIAESISNQRLAAGDYLIRVSRFGSTGNSTYNLTVSGLPGDRAPNTIQTARTLNLSGTNIRAPFTLTGADGAPEFINAADRIDLYKVDLNTAATGRTFLSVRLTNLPNGTADLLLLQDTNNNGRIDDTNGSGILDQGDAEVISISARTGSSPEAIGGTFLDGTYYIMARPSIEGQASFYDLSVYTAPGGTVPTITRDILAGSGSSDPREFTDVSGSLYFAANDGEGYALWKSEGAISTRLGTVQATSKVRAIRQGATSTEISELTDVNGTLYFAANDGVNGTELWKSDGTAAGTVLVKDINTTVGGSSQPRFLTAVGDTLYFVASTQGNNFELWRSDGTTAGTVQVAELGAGLAGSSPESLININGTLFFTANDGVTGRELYRLSPGSTGPQRLDIAPGISNAFPENLTVVNNTGLYFTAVTGANGLEIWKIGADGNPVPLREIRPGSFDSGAANLTAIGGDLYFTAFDSNFRNQLWRIDTANADALTQLTSVDGGSNPSNLVNVNGTLFFSASNGVSGRQIWSTNGIAAGTEARTNIDFDEVNPENLVDVNGVLYFTANDGESGNELWRYNPADSNPQAELVSDIIPGDIGSNPQELTNISGRLFFRADNSFDVNGDGVIDEGEGNGVELWGL